MFAAFSVCISAAESECKKLPENWIITKNLDISDIEKKSMEEIKKHKDIGVPQVPFGHINEQWENLKLLIVNKNQLVMFKSPPDSWKILAGRKGYAVLQNDCIIGGIITFMN